MVCRLSPAHDVAFLVLRGLDVEVNDFFRWPLLRVMEEIEARIRARNREQELMVGLLRVGVPDYGLWQTRELGTDESARLLQRPEAEARAVLHRLVEAGLIEERGQKKGRTWHLSAAVYRLLGDKVAYVRSRGFEPLQQEQMVLQYVEKHGRITRREAAQLCRIASHQARDLLARLCIRGKLVMRGRGKGVFYERGAKNMEGSISAPKDSKRTPGTGEGR